MEDDETTEVESIFAELAPNPWEVFAERTDCSERARYMRTARTLRTPEARRWREDEKRRRKTPEYRAREAARKRVKRAAGKG